MSACDRRLAAIALLGGAASFAGCVGAAVPPTYTQDELRAICERQRGWWHPDTLVGGYCEYRADLGERSAALDPRDAPTAPRGARSAPRDARRATRPRPARGASLDNHAVAQGEPC